MQSNFSQYEDLEVARQVFGLVKLDKKGLDELWNKYFNHAPEIKSSQYMRLKLANKIQEKAFGLTDDDTENRIKQLAKRDKSIISVNRLNKTKKFNAMVGSKIIKMYQGKPIEVLVMSDGFFYNGETYKSLSAIATKITGTRWNGLRFFGVGAE